MSNNNIFKEIQEKREQFKTYAKKALDNNWISQEEYNENLNKIENSKLTIGVIGQMKCGKSTFLNALIFKDEVLPAATTPMTASLSVITYGEEKKLEAEFYTKKEWEELKHFASLDEKEYENDTNQKSKIKAAKEIVEKSKLISDEVNQLLGTKKSDEFENLIEYVGADGKYISITKSVRIEYPLDDLKGVEIVDTPGFNDPVVSREERTKDFLKNADVVVMLLYAGRAFDATDKDIIFNKVGSIGVGKLLIGINKYDINYGQGETITEMVKNTKEQLLSACEEYHNSSISTLVKEQPPLPLSANMALMSEIDLSKIKGNERLEFDYNRALNDFEITNQQQMLEKSLMPEFEQAIRDKIFKFKDEILIKKPVNLIKQKGENQLTETVKNETNLVNKLKTLKMPDDERVEILNNVERAKKRLLRKKDNFKNNLEVLQNRGFRKIKQKLKDLLLENKLEWRNIIDKIGRLQRNKLYNKLKDKADILENDFNKELRRFNESVNREIFNIADEFIIETTEISEKFLEDYEPKDYFLKIKVKIEKEDTINIQMKDFFPNESDDDGFSIVKAVFIGVFSSYFLAIDTILFLLNDKDEYREKVEEFFNHFDLEVIKPIIENNTNDLFKEIEKTITTDFLEPIEQELRKEYQNKEEKELELEKTEKKIEMVKKNKKVIAEQIEEMKLLEPVF